MDRDLSEFEQIGGWRAVACMRVQGFFSSRPMLFGGPTAAALGMVLALGLRVGDQTEPYRESMSAPLIGPAAEAEPIAWPSGKVPDYVIGADFLRKPARWGAPVEVAVSPALEEYQPIDWRPEPDSPPPAPLAEIRATSSRGGVLDVSLPEDAPVAIATPDASKTSAALGAAPTAL